MPRIVSAIVRDVRFPTSRALDGSDAMNPDPDYSAAYVILETDQPGLSGHGLTFTIGRGNDICCMAIERMAELLIGLDLESIEADPKLVWNRLARDSQFRWLGPEKGVVHLATGALVNAAWDLRAKAAGKPLWKLLADMTPEELVAAVDFRHITDALTPEEALAILKAAEPGKAEREAVLRREGYAGYTTSAGWMGYSEDKMRRLCAEAIDEGFTNLKLKVGGPLATDMRRAEIMRDAIGPDRILSMDANQVWEVDQAIAAMAELKAFSPYWIEEPLSPDDILGHRRVAEAVRPIKVATGEHCHNRVMFKQFFQAGALEICQLDSARLGGVNEHIAVLLMAAKFGIPVCPHAGGVGLCEYVQHISFFDYLAVSGTRQGRVIEFVDHLHEHFVDPVIMQDGHYRVSDIPGFSITMKPDSIERFTYPTGEGWR
ncbi:L-fuconate dehydratase [Chthonobacter albigriseus]|uniref:L-fuconate dehydratase n=1 Tax=Chthonobacter albigriseus TaxID=1683161 RepID=UPI0015EF2CC6|nr:L-fuconate dehydratase [Chthonobacter albigriseus]